ncbi:MAG: hypothetical protein HY879_21825 [Deltaproteobacteria bacterium]|nr:hypothetical protein [Deltaproteobacteria bacterium]
MKKGSHLWIGLMGLLIFQGALFLEIGPVATYFYSLIWWSYILTIDGLVYRLRGQSLIVNRTREFLFLIPWSVVIWLLFEGFNLVLKNWVYEGVPKEVVIRWPGYFVAFGTVLPAILETRDLLSALGIFEKSRMAPVRVQSSWYRPLIITGALCLILPLTLPLFFFPLVWIGFIFLLEPFNHRTGRPSFLKDLEQGKTGNLLQFLLSGMVCGLLWEFWNFWAAAKWVYTVPWVGDIKLFEMPVLGFFGFPPFALECFVLVHFLRLLDSRPAGKKNFAWQAIPFWLFFCGVMFAAIDLYTVKSFAG